MTLNSSLIPEKRYDDCGLRSGGFQTVQEQVEHRPSDRPRAGVLGKTGRTRRRREVLSPFCQVLAIVVPRIRSPGDVFAGTRDRGEASLARFQQSPCQRAIMREVTPKALGRQRHKFLICVILHEMTPVDRKRVVGRHPPNANDELRGSDALQYFRGETYADGIPIDLRAIEEVRRAMRLGHGIALENLQSRMDNRLKDRRAGRKAGGGAGEEGRMGRGQRINRVDHCRGNRGLGRRKQVPPLHPKERHAIQISQRRRG